MIFNPAETIKINQKMNDLGRKGIPFLFILDYDLQKPVILPLNQVQINRIKYQTPKYHNVQKNESDKIIAQSFTFKKFPMNYKDYYQAFQKVYPHFLDGGTYLTNLTFPTPIECNLSLEEIFKISKAPYKLWIKDQFVVFSPEAFVKIQSGVISSYPMKGTIKAEIVNAESVILNDPKELAEHITIVDLIRNDLSKVAKRVHVEKFRYITKIVSQDQELLQVSSKISGELEQNYSEKIGDILMALLPAGSISGAPKPKTLEIIREAEGGLRGYYTGVFGVFDGKDLESAVMIRFIEQTHNGYYYRSGGGITYDSNPEQEYQEMVDKVYVPIG